MTDNTNLKAILNMFGAEVKTLVTQIQTETNMEDEHFATVVSGAIVGAMDSSVKTLQVYKSNELLDKQIITEEKKALDITSSIKVKDQQELAEKIKNGVVAITYTYDTATESDLTTQDYEVASADGNTITAVSYQAAEDGTKSIYEVQKEVEEAKIRQVDEEIAIKEDQSAKDLLIKDQQELAEKIKNGGIYYEYTYNEDGTIATKTLAEGTTKSIYEVQKEIGEVSRDLNKEKLEQTRKMTPFVLDGARIDNDTRQQKYITEQLRNGGIGFEYTFYKSYIDDTGNFVETNYTNGDTITVDGKEYVLFKDYKRVASKTLNEGTGLSLVELQNLKTQEETNYIQSQNTQLVASVGYNNKLKVLNSLSNLWGTLGAGGFIVPDTGWKPVFEISKDLAGTTLPTLDSLSTFQTDITSV